MNINDFLFRPNQDVKQFLSILLIISIVAAAVLAVWLIVYLRRSISARNMAWKRFRVLAQRYVLTRQEISFLKILIVQLNISQPSRILTSTERFEKLVKLKAEKGKRYEKKMIRSLREKLFGRTLQPFETVRSTHSIPVGTRLFVKYTDHPDEALWAHLVDVDHNGLIAVIPSPHRIHIPMRVDTSLEITAFIPQREPVVFKTWVKSVIPGRRKMFVLGHSNFVVDRKGLGREARLVGPQSHRDDNNASQQKDPNESNSIQTALHV